MLQSKKIAAFFDFDGTLYEGVIAFDFLRFAIRSKALKFNEMKRLPKFLYYYALDKFKIAERYDINVRIYKKVKGWNHDSLMSTAKKFFNNKGRKKLIPEIVNNLNEHKLSQHLVIIVTSALKEIVSPINEWLEVDKIIATEVGSDNGSYNGIIKSLPVGRARVKIIDEYCKLNNIDMSKSYAYSDHYSDIPLLKAVGNPVATNPERKLRKYARKHGWRILDA